jgi:predicted GNAT family N-acyltransferase
MIVDFISAEQTHPLRNAVLNTSARYGSDVLEGDSDPDTFHLGAIEDDEVVGIATFLKRQNDWYEGKRSYQLRGMAIDPERRGDGIGTKMLSRAEEILRDKDIEIVWADARTVAVGFYTKAGWVLHGQEFDKGGIPHFVMGKELI